jgi:nitrogenase subunit NifH
MSTKDQIHDLVETIDDEEILKAYLQLIKNIAKNKNGALWSNLTADEEHDLLLSYNESFDRNNIISHEEVKNQHSKWLEK